MMKNEKLKSGKRSLTTNRAAPVASLVGSSLPQVLTGQKIPGAELHLLTGPAGGTWPKNRVNALKFAYVPINSHSERIIIPPSGYQKTCLLRESARMTYRATPNGKFMNAILAGIEAGGLARRPET